MGEVESYFGIIVKKTFLFKINKRTFLFEVEGMFIVNHYFFKQIRISGKKQVCDFSKITQGIGDRVWIGKKTLLLHTPKEHPIVSHWTGRPGGESDASETVTTYTGHIPG